MSYEYLPDHISGTTVHQSDTNSHSNSAVTNAENLLLSKTESPNEPDYEQNCFLLGQFYTEQQQPDKAVTTFSKIASSEKNASVFARQAKYQVSILCFDQGLVFDTKMNPFDELEKLAAQSTDLFSVCANYNLGLATFNGYNPNIPSGKVLEVACRYWLEAAGGDVHQLSEPRHVKALDIFMPDAQKSLSQEEKELNFYKAMAQCKLGQLYTYNSELRNEELSFFWHTEAASNGNIESQGCLGVMNLEGIGCRKNEKSGLYCLKHATAAKDFYAAGRLAEYYYKNKLYSHCISISKPYAVKFLLDTKCNILDQVRTGAKQIHCSESFAVKGAVLCAFYFARCVEKRFYDVKSLSENDENKDDEDVLLEGFSNDDIPIKIYRACAEIEPSLMVEMQQLKLEGIV